MPSLQELLKGATGQLILYPLGDTSPSAARKLEYSRLHSDAQEISYIIRNVDGFTSGSPVLLHFDDHFDNIVWFWAVLLANGLPVMSSPFSNNADHRQKHIAGLSELLLSPICVTRERALSSFGTHHPMRIFAAEGLLEELDRQRLINSDGRNNTTGSLSLDSPAMLMLTSGSTGNAKAVEITHRQALAAVAAKAAVRPLHGKPFLNWIGLDHVAALLEIHLQALYLKQDQVHVAAADIVSSPRHFLDLLDRHQVSRTFAPNFFLGRLAAEVQIEEQNNQSHRAGQVEREWNLENLVILGSGGEADDTNTCVAVSSMIERYGGPCDAILPGFGMTETCAGIIYNTECPSYDIAQAAPFVCLGKCVKGVQMRISLSGNSAGESERQALPGELGFLEVRGDLVFCRYFRNTAATEQGASLHVGWLVPNRQQRDNRCAGSPDSSWKNDGCDQHQRDEVRHCGGAEQRGTRLGKTRKPCCLLCLKINEILDRAGHSGIRSRRVAVRVPAIPA